MHKILIIDDNDSFREALKEALQRSGFEVVEAENGDSGVQLYREQKPDLVITDIVMPVKGGMQVIKELESEFPSVKIIAISGGMRNDGREELDLVTAFTNVVQVFEKPFAIQDLISKIKEMLSEA